MDLKDFLKPDWKKLLIFLLFVSLITIFFQPSVVGGCCTKETDYFVLPFNSITHREIDCNSPLASTECKPESSFKINYSFLALNLVFWYLISCFIIEVYDKFSKKAEKK
jgi:hypothetical protein